MNKELEEVLKTYSLLDVYSFDELSVEERENIELSLNVVNVVGEVIIIDEYSTPKGYEGMYLFYLPKHNILIRDRYDMNDNHLIEEVERVGEYGAINYKSTIR